MDGKVRCHKPDEFFSGNFIGGFLDSLRVAAALNDRHDSARAFGSIDDQIWFSKHMNFHPHAASRIAELAALHRGEIQTTSGWNYP